MDNGERQPVHKTGRSMDTEYACGLWKHAVPSLKTEQTTARVLDEGPAYGYHTAPTKRGTKTLDFGLHPV